MPEHRGDGSTRPARIRCAIYTRKSSEEGLEQEFNSLDAQREACAAYVTSQRHEGWRLLPTMYDDGGYSGGTMERPALRRLLADIDARKIDVVVVYKVDRLTRALSDFAKIVEAFDAHAVSFVSVTQSFNTTSSMGRLTLNVLLSFAQFEREVTGERIRDKIAASKKKGMWMGGLPSLGYDVKDRKLVVNKEEAEIVRHIFRRYVELRSVRVLKAELDAAGVVSKLRKAADGRSYGGRPLSRGALYLMLQNRIYRGEIVHKGTAFPGEHAAIVDEELWSRAQSRLEANRVARREAAEAFGPSLLTGILFDANDDSMTPTHALKKNTRYRYYASRHLICGPTAEKSAGQRIPAANLEELVERRIRSFVADPVAILDAIPISALDATGRKKLAAAAKTYVAGWDDETPDDLRRLLISMIVRVRVLPDRVDVCIDPMQMAARLLKNGFGVAGLSSGAVDDGREEQPTILSIPTQLKRTGKELRFVVEGAREAAFADRSLIRLLARAHKIGKRLHEAADLTIDKIAQDENITPSYATRLLRLTFLAPDIVTAILAGAHPRRLTANKLMADTRLPMDWREQRTTLGFA